MDVITINMEANHDGDWRVLGAKLNPSKLSLTVIMIISIIITLAVLLLPTASQGLGALRLATLTGILLLYQEMQFVQEELKFTEPH